MKHNKNNGTMWKWFYSYTAALLLPVLFGVVLYLFSVRTIVRQGELLQAQNAEKDYRYLEQTLEGIASNAQNIMLNDEVTYFSERRSFYKEEAIQVKKVQEVLKGFCLANKAIQSIYVFYPQEGFIITNVNFLNMEKNTLLGGQIGLYQEPFQSILQENPYNRIFMIEAGSQNYLFYTLCRDGQKSFFEQSLVVMVRIDQQILTGQLAGGASSALLLTVMEENTISGQEPVLLELGNRTLSKAARSYIREEDTRKRNPGSEYDIHKKELEDYGLVMWNVYSNEEAKQGFKRIWLLLAVYMICCIVLGPVMVYWISRRNYAPVEELIQLMESSGLQTGEKDEFALIHHNLLALLKGIRDKQKALRWQQDFYEESDLYFLLCTNRAQSHQDGYHHEAASQKGSTLQGSTLQGSGEKRLVHDGFLVTAFDAEDVKEVLYLEDDTPGGSLELLDFVIANVVQEFYADIPARVSGKLGNLYYVIANFPAEELTEKNALIWEKTQSICRFLQERFEFAICANISRFKQSISELPEAYRELREIEEFRNYIGSEETILCYDTFSGDEEIRKEMNYFTKINQLSELLRAHRHKEAEELQAEIRRTWNTTEWMEAEEADRKSKLAEAWSELPEGKIATELTGEDLTAEPDGAEDGNTIRTVMETERGRKEAAMISGQGSKSAEQTVRRVEEYLYQHYLDPQLNVSSIAHLFDLNASYLSRSFCKITGRGMLEYLTALRLEHAKKCMEQGESVNRAAEQSGFYSCRPFIRAFKQEMGVTPGEYYKKKKGEA